MNKERLGSLISVVGLDGCGKSTTINNIRKVLISNGYETAVTKANTDDNKEKYGRYLEGADDIETLLTFLLMQRQQYRETVARLAIGSIVIADRWDESFNAYHSNYGILSKDESLRDKLHDLAFGDVTPDKTIYLRMTPEQSAKRMARRGELDYFDKKSLEYNDKIAAFYDHELATRSEWMEVDATMPEEEVARVAIGGIMDAITRDSSEGSDEQ